MAEEKFFGPLKVESVTDLNGEEVEVVYSNGEKEVITKKMFELGVTAEQKDWGFLIEVRNKALGNAIVDLIMQYDIRVYEVDGLLKYVIKEITGRVERAINFLWTKDDKKFTAGTDPQDMFSILEAERIIKSIPNEPTVEAAKE